VTAPREYKRDPKGSDTGGQFTVSQKSPTAKPAPRKAAKAAPEPIGKASSARFKTLAPGEDNDPATVKEMQQLLSSLGLGKLAVDGKYGPATTEAVKAAQRKLGLKATGKASKTLVGKLLAAYDLSPCIKRSRVPDADIERGVPHPGQRYRHDWEPVFGLDIFGKSYSNDEIRDDYGDTVDNDEFAPGAYVELAADGYLRIDVAAEQPERYHVFAESFDQAEADELADDLDWAIDHQTGLIRKGARPPDPRNGLVDWQERNEFLVGYGPDDLIRLGRKFDTDDFDSMDLSVDEATELMRALRRLSTTALPGEEEADE
jgi:hypothetical protein